LVPGIAAEANREKTIGRNIDVTKRFHEISRILVNLFTRSTGKAQLRTAATGNGSEDSMSGMTVKWMTFGTYAKRIERGCIAFREIDTSKADGRLIQLVDKPLMPLLPGHDTFE
jgi:hypothetical protein